MSSSNQLLRSHATKRVGTRLSFSHQRSMTEEELPNNLTLSSDFRVCNSGRSRRDPQPLDKFGIRTKNTKYGKASEPTSSCLEWMEHDAKKKLKRKSRDTVEESSVLITFCNFSSIYT